MGTWFQLLGEFIYIYLYVHMQFNPMNFSETEHTICCSVFCSREKVIGLKEIQQNEKSTQSIYTCVYKYQNNYYTLHKMKIIQLQHAHIF